MKKYFIITAMLIFLCGCNADKASTVFSLTNEQTAEYKEQIANTLSEYSWGYNPDAIVFSQATMPEKTDSLYTLLDTFTSDGGLKAANYAAKQVIQASVPLQHINGSNVGSAYFYFNSDEPDLVCSYYVYKDKYYAMSTKNPFELTDVLTSYEDTQKFSAFRLEETRVPFTSVPASNNGIFAAVAENDVAFFYDSANSFRACTKADYTGRGLIPMDITLGDDFGAILLGERVKVQQNENENEVSDIINEPPAKSKYIAITDSKGKPTGTLISTTVSSFTSLTQVGNSLYFARDKSIDEFIYENNTLVKKNTYMLDHYASYVRSADIDGNGTVEFIISDGTNIYVYEKSVSFNLIWRSNSYLSSIIGNIYIGDVNADGIKELYIKDSTGVTARYVLTPQGFKINSGGIVSGGSESYIVADFNNDGKCDYMLITDDEAHFIIHLAN